MVPSDCTEMRDDMVDWDSPRWGWSKNGNQTHESETGSWISDAEKEE